MLFNRSDAIACEYYYNSFPANTDVGLDSFKEDIHLAAKKISSERNLPGIFESVLYEAGYIVVTNHGLEPKLESALT
jgi:hypothetical protein